MVKNFAAFLSAALILIGVVNFFWFKLGLYVPQAILHILAGGAGLAFAFRNDGVRFLRWAGVVFIVLAALAFLGFSDIFGIFKLPLWLYWLYLILGLIALWVSMSFNNSENNS